MPDDLPDDHPSHPTAVLSVRELTAYIKRLFERDEVLADVLVRGEVSNFKRYRYGHLYFTLKDEVSALDCVCFRNIAAGVGFDLADGLQVIAAGRVTVYEKQGRYQLIVLFLRPDGMGALAAAFERLRAKLDAEGLFDESRKRPLPRFPRCIALVTSPTGAAVQDLTNILTRRFPLARILLIPTQVQGDDAPDSIVASLRAADAHPDVDLIIAGRGGGSLEDLWAFNDERVVRALFACRKPTISAVGHETDTTLADFVADVRAPTPSAAAELAVPDAAELLQHLAGLARHARTAVRARLDRASAALHRVVARPPLSRPTALFEQRWLRLDAAADRADQSLAHLLQRGRQRLSLAAATLEAHRPHRMMALRRQRFADLARRLHRAVAHGFERGGWRLRHLEGKLEALSPVAVLERGYSITLRQPAGEVVRSARQVAPPDELRILLAEGELRATTTSSQVPDDPGDAEHDPP
jgi:exodeoxyribonuclease VII large subunit